MVSWPVTIPTNPIESEILTACDFTGYGSNLGCVNGRFGLPTSENSNRFKMSERRRIDPVNQSASYHTRFWANIKWQLRAYAVSSGTIFPTWGESLAAKNADHFYLYTSRQLSLATSQHEQSILQSSSPQRLPPENNNRTLAFPWPHKALFRTKL